MYLWRRTQQGYKATWNDELNDFRVSIRLIFLWGKRSEYKTGRSQAQIDWKTCIYVGGDIPFLGVVVYVSGSEDPPRKPGSIPNLGCKNFKKGNAQIAHYW